jgi:proline iminopeptidase
VEIEVNGTRLWFDVDGPVLGPDSDRMRERPTLVLLHGGPGGFDHSYLRPHFSPLADVAQVVSLDLRDHGRSARHDPDAWSFESCADDVRAFCDALGIHRPLVLGHSMGGFVALLYGARHPGHAGGLILQSTVARFDLDRLTDGVRRVAGDEVAAVARRDYGGEDVSAEEFAPVWLAFGPHVPDAAALRRIVRNPDVNPRGLSLLRTFDASAQLARITSPTLVCVGELDPVTPVPASEEIVAGLRHASSRLEVLAGAGHFPWLDVPDRYRSIIAQFIAEQAPSQ